jgi:hypothetical protein
VFRWQRLWPQVAAYYGVEPAPFDGVVRPLAERMADAPARWAAIAARHGLREADVARLAWWGTQMPTWAGDGDAGRHDKEPQGRLP